VCAALRARRWQPSIPPGRYFRLALRQFLKPGARQALPDHSVLLQLVAEHTLAKGRGVGVDASTMEGNAAMRTIMRRAASAGWQAMLGTLAPAPAGWVTNSTGRPLSTLRARTIEVAVHTNQGGKAP
jgi:transposase